MGRREDLARLPSHFHPATNHAENLPERHDSDIVHSQFLETLS
jgi:hypothetical protein